MAAFYTYVYYALQICPHPSNLFIELNYVKSFALARSYNPSNINKTINKFKKSKRSACHYNSSLKSACLPFYSSIAFKTSKILSQFGCKVSFKFINKIIFPSY